MSWSGELMFTTPFYSACKGPPLCFLGCLHCGAIKLAVTPARNLCTLA
jgi:hypothetical protein